MKKIIELKEQIFKFGIVGILAFILDYLILYILTNIFDIYYLISASFAFCIATIINYILSTIWVFNVKQVLTKEKQFIIFVVLSLIGLIINVVVMYVSVENLEIHYLIAKIMATIIVMVWNFITKKRVLEGHF